MATSSSLLWKTLEIEAFRGLSMVLSVLVLSLFLYVATRTAYGVYTGSVLCVFLLLFLSVQRLIRKAFAATRRV